MSRREMDAWVAEHVMGWRLAPPERQGRSLTLWIKPDGLGENDPALTSFSLSLEAAASAEMEIRELGLWEVYALALCDLVNGEVIEDLDDGRETGRYLLGPMEMFDLATANARLRCEAMYAIRDEIKEARHGR